jgi:hypothetical protein
LRWSGTFSEVVAEHLGARHLTLTALTRVRIIMGAAVFALRASPRGSWLRELWWRMMIAAASKLP